MYVEVFAGAEPGRHCRLLPAAITRAAVPSAGRSGRTTAEGAGRAGAAAADVPDRLAPRRRGMRLRPDWRVRPITAHDQSPPEGAARGRPAGQGEARRLGLLPGPDRGPGQPGRADRLPVRLTGGVWSRRSRGQRGACMGRTAERGGDAMLSFTPGRAAAAADRCETAGQVPAAAGAVEAI